MPTARSTRRGSYRGADRSADELFDLATQVGSHLTARALRVVTAESCTGGWIAKALTDVPGASSMFAEGYVAYGNIAKHRDLRVSAEAIRRHGAVSRQVVQQMARGALTRTGADVAVAVSGVAGPDGGTPAKPVGTVWFCWAERADRAERLRTALRYFSGDREAVRRKAVAFALRGLLPDPPRPQRRSGLGKRKRASRKGRGPEGSARAGGASARRSQRRSTGHRGRKPR